MLRYLYPLLGIDEVGGNVDDPYHNMVLLIVPEHADDHCCCSNCSSGLFSLILGLNFVSFVVTGCFLFCCQIGNIHNLIIGLT
jgi:hypothetical protein